MLVGYTTNAQARKLSFAILCTIMNDVKCGEIYTIWKIYRRLQNCLFTKFGLMCSVNTELFSVQFGRTRQEYFKHRKY